MLPSIIAPAISFPSLVKAQVVTAVFLPGWFTQLHRHRIISELLLNTAKLAFLIINLTLCLLVGGVSTLSGARQPQSGWSLNSVWCQTTSKWVESQLCLVPDNLKVGGVSTLSGARQPQSGWSLNSVWCQTTSKWVESQLCLVPDNLKVGGVSTLSGARQPQSGWSFNSVWCQTTSKSTSRSPLCVP